jgi:adenylate kinase
MEKKIHLLTGVSGTGKSTLADRLAQRLPRTSAVHASRELHEVFGRFTQDQRGRICYENKMGEIATHLAMVFDRKLNDYDRLLFDTHLLVPVSGEVRTYESVWSEQYCRYMASAALIMALPQEIRAWRYHDKLRTGRKRDLSEVNIAQDQTANLSYFEELTAKGLLPVDSQVIHNEDGQLEQTEELIISQILAR